MGIIDSDWLFYFRDEMLINENTETHTHTHTRCFYKKAKCDSVLTFDRPFKY